jgi:hypothetical protein
MPSALYCQNDGAAWQPQRSGIHSVHENVLIIASYDESIMGGLSASMEVTPCAIARFALTIQELRPVSLIDDQVNRAAITSQKGIIIFQDSGSVCVCV